MTSLNLGQNLAVWYHSLVDPTASPRCCGLRGCEGGLVASLTFV